MANFENFTDDEHIILSHVFACNALANKVAELTGYTANEIYDDVALFAANRIGELSLSECRDLINQHRESFKSYRRVRKIIQNNADN